MRGSSGWSAVHQRLKRELGLFEIRVQVHQVCEVLLQDLIHPLALLVGQIQLADQGRIVPEAAVRAEITEGPLHRRAVRAKSGAPARPPSFQPP